MPDFVDEVTVHVQAGGGGHGCTSIHREKFKPLGGPDGGNGGRGGSVIFEVAPGATSLLDFHRRPHRKAGNGRGGQGSNRSGADGTDLVLAVPDGTVVKTAESDVLADLMGIGTRFVAARGGRGGLGNAALASPRRKAPGFALRGEPGEKRDLVLELKTVADAGLVGFPNAGKSSLIAALSAARPKIAGYPFTTLVPNLGVVDADGTQFVVADVPGLIPGASEGRGLGHRFLRHIERCSTLIHVIDCAAPAIEPGRDPVTDLDAIEAELAAHGEAAAVDLSGRPRIAVLNKIDVPAAREAAERAKPVLEARGIRVCETSAGTREGLRELTYAIADLVKAARGLGEAVPGPALGAGHGPAGGAGRGPGRGRAAGEPPRPVIRPAPLGEPGFEVVRTGPNQFRIRGGRPRLWVQQTDFGNDEAVGYLADRLARLGVEKALADAGAQAGAEVLIGDEDDAVVFDWEPALPSGPDGTAGLGPRGTDRRLG